MPKGWVYNAHKIYFYTHRKECKMRTNTDFLFIWEALIAIAKDYSSQGGAFWREMLSLVVMKDAVEK